MDKKILTDDEIYDLVEQWHDAPKDSEIARNPIYVHLGMNQKEYWNWIEAGSV